MEENPYAPSLSGIDASIEVLLLQSGRKQRLFEENQELPEL